MWGLCKSRTRAGEGDEGLDAKMLASWRGRQEGDNLVFNSRKLIQKLLKVLHSWAHSLERKAFTWTSNYIYKHVYSSSIHKSPKLETMQVSMNKMWKTGGFPGGAVVENPPANAGDTGSSPGLGRSHMPRSN